MAEPGSDVDGACLQTSAAALIVRTANESEHQLGQLPNDDTESDTGR